MSELLRVLVVRIEEDRILRPLVVVFFLPEMA